MGVLLRRWVQRKGSGTAHCRVRLKLQNRPSRLHEVVLDGLLLGTQARTFLGAPDDLLPCGTKLPVEPTVLVVEMLDEFALRGGRIAHRKRCHVAYCPRLLLVLPHLVRQPGDD